MKKIRQLTVIQLLLLIFILLPSLCFAASKNANHVIIMDAGSTGTRLSLFKYDFKEKSVNGMPEVILIKKVEVTPGVASDEFIKRPGRLRSYLDPLFEQIDNQLTTLEKNETPIYLFATGGVRSLPANQQKTLMYSLSNTLVEIILGLNYSLPADMNKNVQVLDGAKEGLFSWLAVNYLNGALNHDKLRADLTYPVLDLGGESTQITFLSPTKPEKNSIVFTMNKIPYSLYAYSYGAFGVNSALNNIIADNTLTAANNLAPCFPVDTTYPVKNPIITNGKGNFSQCVAFLHNYTFPKMKIQTCQFHYQNNCTQMGVYQPPITQSTVYAADSYFYTLSILGLANKPVSLQQINEQATKYCSMSFNDLKKQYSQSSDEFLRTYCFNAAWINTLLTGYGFNDTKRLIAVNAINNTSTSWTLGGAIYVLTQ